MLGQLAKRAWPERRWVQTNAEAVEQLIQHTVCAARSAEIGARELANIAYGAASAFAKVSHSDVQLFTTLAREAERHIGDFNPQELANTAWAFAKVGLLDAQLFKVLAREAERRVGDFKPQELANTAQGFATLGHTDALLFAALA